MTPISRQIKEKMTERGLSAHALEKLAGLKLSAVQNIIYGRSKNPSMNILLPIAQALDCTVSELLEEDVPVGGHKNISLAHTPTSNLPWNPDLYLATFQIMNTLAKNKNLALSREKMASGVEEAYAYSLKNKKSRPDRHFAAWLIEKMNT